jgi:NAD(P)-dependent dehydrogenase (short-subunit alcohol dehydrogenase family)
MVTGATSGIGRAAALSLARKGAELILVARDRARGEAAVEEIMRASGNPEVELLCADLGEFEQVHALAREFLGSRRPLHVLLNNAGAVFARRQETRAGVEATLAVNHLGPFLLTNLLLERLRASAPARIVNVASDAHRFAGALDFGDLESRRRYRALKVYGKSKLMNLLFTRELARRLAGSGVSVHALHPGFVASGLGTNNGWLGRAAMRVLSPFARSPEKGAETAVFLASARELESRSGGYWLDCRPHALHPAAQRDEDAARLWELRHGGDLTGSGPPPVSGAAPARPARPTRARPPAWPRPR